MDVKVDPPALSATLLFRSMIILTFFFLSVYECLACMSGCASEDVRSLRSHHVGAGNQTWVLLITEPSL